jgi:hypothetical protein
MRNTQLIANHVAVAIKSCGGGRITTEAAKVAMQALGTASQPSDMVENMAVFFNLSALNQELERCGIVRAERTLTALQAQIRDALALLNAPVATPTPPAADTKPTPPAAKK